MRQLRNFRLVQFPPAAGPGDAPPPASHWIRCMNVNSYGMIWDDLDCFRCFSMTWGFQYVLHFNPICTVEPVVLDAVEMDLCHTNGSLPESPGEFTRKRFSILSPATCFRFMCVHPFQRWVVVLLRCLCSVWSAVAPTGGMYFSIRYFTIISP